MAYQSQISLKARSAVIALVIAIHVGLLLVLLSLSERKELESAQSALRIIDIRQLLPPPEPRHPPKPAKPRAKPASSEPSNVKSSANQVFTPKPQIQIPKVEPVEATQTPRQGTLANQGASPSTGPGTGAGGSGNGAGGGSGTGGDNGVIEPPRLASPVMSGRDFSGDQLMQWPRGATVFLRLRIDPKGYVAECVVDRGTKIAAIDGAICNLAHDRLRFRPALNRNGQAVAGWFGYAQPAPR